MISISDLYMVTQHYTRLHGYAKKLDIFRIDNGSVSVKVLQLTEELWVWVKGKMISREELIIDGHTIWAVTSVCVLL